MRWLGVLSARNWFHSVCEEISHCHFCKRCLVTAYWPDGSISGCNLLFVKCFEIPDGKDFCVKSHSEFHCYFTCSPSSAQVRPSFHYWCQRLNCLRCLTLPSHFLHFCCNKQINVFDQWDNGRIVKVWMTALWQVRAEGCLCLPLPFVLHM